jgi:hypothetical protein
MQLTEPRYDSAKESYEQYELRRRKFVAARNKQRLAVVGALAKALGATCESRHPNDNDHWRWATLTLAGRTFHFSIDEERTGDKYRVSGQWPRMRRPDGQTTVITPKDCGAVPYNETLLEIKGSVSKGAAAIARDIERRFLPWFVPVFDKCKERADADTDRANQALQAAHRLAKQLGGERVAGNGTQASLYLPSIMETITVRMEGGEARLSFEYRASDMSATKAIPLIQMLAKLER